MNKTCKDCIHLKVCEDIDDGIQMCYAGYKGCENFKDKNRFVEVVRCGECKHAVPLDKHCELNQTIYKHCTLLHGEPEDYVWHKYKKYYKNYSIVEDHEFCSYGERKGQNDDR